MTASQAIEGEHMSNQGKELVRRMYEEVWNRGDLGVVDEICDSDYRGIGPYGNELGPEAVKRGVASRRAAFPDIHVSIEDMLVEGDKVAARLTFAGKHRGPFQGIEATGKRVQWSGIWIYRIADGRFVERWHSYDMLGLLRQIGGVTT